MSQHRYCAEMLIIKSTSAAILLIFWPFIHFVATNQAMDLDYGRIVVVLVSVIALTLAMAAGLAAIFRRLRPDRWIALVSTAVVASFLFGPMAKAMQEYGYFRYYQAAIWPLLTLTLLALVWHLSRNPKFITVLFGVASSLIVVSAIPIVMTMETAVSDAPQKIHIADRAPLEKTSHDRPSVFYLVLDMYGRSDQLLKHFGLDNLPFLSALKYLGFSVADDSLANYPTTIQSLASALSMDFIVDEGEVFDWTPGSTEYRRARRTLAGYNTVVSGFRDLGYYYAHGGGENIVRCGNEEDYCLRAKSTTWLGEQERALLLMTPFRLFRYRIRYKAEKFTPKVVGDAIAKLRVFRIPCHWHSLNIQHVV
jgi:hypothetical protein